MADLQKAERQMSTPAIVECYFDGACFPNPNGHAASGAFITRGTETIFTHSKYLGNLNTSNNVAEYAGLIAILKYLVEQQIHEAIIYGDSMLVIKQMTGKWRAGTLSKAERKGKCPIKPRYYLPYFDEAMRLRLQLHSLEFRWIPRSQNEAADELSKRPLIARGLRVSPGERETDLGYARMRFEQAII